jgi:hypothetical protein
LGARNFLAQPTSFKKEFQKDKLIGGLENKIFFSKKETLLHGILTCDDDRAGGGQGQSKKTKKNIFSKKNEASKTITPK